MPEGALYWYGNFILGELWYDNGWTFYNGNHYTIIKGTIYTNNLSGKVKFDVKESYGIGSIEAIDLSKYNHIKTIAARYDAENPQLCIGYCESKNISDVSPKNIQLTVYELYESYSELSYDVSSITDIGYVTVFCCGSGRGFNTKAIWLD